MKWRVGAVLTVALACAACGSEPVGGPAGSPSDSVDVATRASSASNVPPSSTGALQPGALPFGLATCTFDVTVAADPSYYRDEPVYVANEQPIDDVRAWALDQPGFEELWIDRAHNGWLAVGFSEGAAERQAELEELFPGEGVVAVDLAYGQADLDRLRDAVYRVMEEQGLQPNGGSSVPFGFVDAWVGVLDETTLEPFRQFAGQPVCFQGVDPAHAVQDGPQPTSGDGWRLLGVEQVGEAYRTGVATDEQRYAALWSWVGLSAERPVVDFTNEIVVWFGAVYGSSCPIRMDDVVVDTSAALVHARFVVPGNPGSCTSDANPEAYVVAVERDRLPAGPFAVQLGPVDPPPGAPEERTLVDADLSTPGSVATADQLGPDPALFGRDAGYVVSSGGYLEADFTGAQYVLDLTCPLGVLGPFNGVVWQADDPALTDSVPAAWTKSAEPGATAVIVDLWLATANDDHGPQLTVTFADHTETYSPAPAGTAPRCP